MQILFSSTLLRTLLVPAAAMSASAKVSEERPASCSREVKYEFLLYVSIRIERSLADPTPRKCICTYLICSTITMWSSMEFRTVILEGTADIYGRSTIDAISIVQNDGIGNIGAQCSMLIFNDGVGGCMMK